MNKYEWLRGKDLYKLITRKEQDFLWGTEFAFVIMPHDLLLKCVLTKLIGHDDDSKSLRFLLDNELLDESSCRVAMGVATRNLSRRCERELIDFGVCGDFLSTGKEFIESRKRARSSAILVTHAMCKVNKTYKNVSVIIGRVIWASRGDCENWLRDWGEVWRL